ncbi:MAG: protein translocase subunit SecD [Thermoleophilaceae bacterium]|nr:protein translocase subunit SecD [Thermoleophilaceae bacterium]
MASRKRNLIILGLVGLLLAGSIAAIVLKPTRLGLDLAGGIELVYKASPTNADRDPTERELQNAIEVINDRVNALGVTEAEVQATGNDLITVSLPDVDDPQAAKTLVGSTAQMFFYKWEENIVGKPGQSKSTSDAESSNNRGATKQYDAVKLASKQKPGETGRDKYYLFSTKKGNKLIAGPELSKEELLKADNQLTKDKAPLEGKQPEDSEILVVPKGYIVVSNDTLGTGSGTQWFVLRDNVAMSGDEVKSATVGTDGNGGGGPAVDLSFTGEGGDIFQKITAELHSEGSAEPTIGQKQGHRFAVVLDGEIVSLASINPNDASLSQGIAGGAAQITGVTQKEATDIARQIDLGALPVQLELQSETTVSASLGKAALDQALIAALAGFAFVFLFLLIFYRILGIIAGVALIFYAVFFFALTKLVGFTFTLPGIAGLVLTLAVAADANIVIFERIKEEIRAGKSMKSAISTGYSKGFATILDANVVTLITAFILFVLATSGVRGFAASLGLGTIVSLFTAVLVTSAILGLLSNWRGLERPSALGVQDADEHRQRWQFDFMGKSKTFFSISGMILAAGAFAIAGMGLNLGIDFTGGTKIVVGLQKPASEEQVRAVVAAVGADDAKIQRITNDKTLGPNAFQISSDKISEEQDVSAIRRAFDAKFKIRATSEADTQFAVSAVGPTFGAVIAKSAITAIIFSLIVIGGYVALRFGVKFAVPLLIALAHDLLITLGVYALLGQEVSSATVAALLTILGFSLYDTIIVFDRVRENLPRMPRAAFSQIVNRSMSEVLTRSLATSLCTVLPVLALLLFGGSTLQAFAFALLVGTISGTYSSIFIAAPVLMLSKEREPIFRQRRARILEENDGVIPAFATETIGGVAVHASTGKVLEQIEETPDSQVDEEPVDEELEGAVPAGASSGATAGAVKRPQTKAERRAARAKRKHGR